MVEKAMTYEQRLFLGLATDYERFARKVSPEPNTGCWLWIGAYTVCYGTFYLGKRNMAAHRASYILHVGPIADGLLACHKCDNSSCVNPAHLFLGTQKENIRDCIEKGRFVKRAKKTHCPQGHDYAEDGFKNKLGAFVCRVCRKQKGREWMRQRRAELRLNPQ